MHRYEVTVTVAWTHKVSEYITIERTAELTSEWIKSSEGEAMAAAVDQLGGLRANITNAVARRL